jgi:hypothetical protein
MLIKKLFLLFLMGQMHCSYDWDSARYGIQKVLVGEHSIYFKREIRGRNYDGLSISTDGNLCNGPSAKTDYFVDSETPGRVFFKVENNVLQIYSQSVFTAPQNNDFTILITQKYIPAQDFSENDAIKLGYTELLLPIDSLKNCDKK